ncbi:helix-turn-helix domain-containing protein [Brevundimonas sp.]|uniref:Crp/Fnr family transcriptional regulator n=1 Tax=Brevundimonas sp. TaxID=1871086 RepID=UPI0025C60B58|nr:helix-turn-helix domain-containing protein [Brevundimonas sp.]
MTHVYFPETAQLANTVTFADGRSAEPFVMGTEGVSALAACLTEKPCAWSVDVEVSGLTYQLPASVLREQAAGSPEVRRTLDDITYDYQVQAALAAACASLHAAPARLAKLLLIRSDRLGVPLLHLTQEELAQRLGLLRSTVNTSANRLKADGAIEYSRGNITIRNRSALISAACECYLEQGAVLQGKAHCPKNPERA